MVITLNTLESLVDLKARETLKTISEEPKSTKVPVRILKEPWKTIRGPQDPEETLKDFSESEETQEVLLRNLRECYRCRKLSEQKLLKYQEEPQMSLMPLKTVLEAL